MEPICVRDFMSVHVSVSVASSFLPCVCLQDNLESMLVATHQDMELCRTQPLTMEKLQLKKESLQNQLINVRGELSQASNVNTLML